MSTTWQVLGLARNLKGAFEVIDELTSVGTGFVSVHEQMDSTTPEGRLALQNMAAIHEFYSRNIGRRWKMVQSDRVDKGLPSGGPVRFGYQQAPAERLQSPHPENGPVLAQMYRDFIAGQGAQKIAMSLNERGVKTGRGNAWDIQTVLRTLDSGFGAGLVQADGEFRDGAHVAVITKGEWEQYRRVRDSRRMKAPRHKSPQWHLAGWSSAVCAAEAWSSRRTRTRRRSWSAARTRTAGRALEPG